MDRRVMSRNAKSLITIIKIQKLSFFLSRKCLLETIAQIRSGGECFHDAVHGVAILFFLLITSHKHQ